MILRSEAERHKASLESRFQQRIGEREEAAGSALHVLQPEYWAVDKCSTQGWHDIGNTKFAVLQSMQLPLGIPFPSDAVPTAQTTPSKGR